jgi:hypothetical protein
MRLKNLPAAELHKLIKEEGGIGILAGTEFGSNKFKQFPIWSGSQKTGGEDLKVILFIQRFEKSNLI